MGMLNEVRARHLKKLVEEQIASGKPAGLVLEFEIARREHTIIGLETQKARKKDEIVYLKTLDAKEQTRDSLEREIDG